MWKNIFAKGGLRNTVGILGWDETNKKVTKYQDFS